MICNAIGRWQDCLEATLTVKQGSSRLTRHHSEVIA